MIGHGDEEHSANVSVTTVVDLVKRSNKKLRVLGALSCKGSDFVAAVANSDTLTSDAFVFSYWGYANHAPLRNKRISTAIQSWAANPQYTDITYGNLVTSGFGTVAIDKVRDPIAEKIYYYGYAWGLL